MTTYRYLLADLRTNNILSELMLTNVNYTQQLNSAGTMTASLLISDASQSATDIFNSTIPARTAIYVDRNGVLVWGGIIWSREYNSKSQHIEISAKEFESYFEHRRITTTQVFSGVDQFAIVESLINSAQSVTGGNIGINVPTNLSGVSVSRTYFAAERKTVLSAIQDLSQSTNGFDFGVSVAYDGLGNPTKSFSLSYPQSGNRWSASNPYAPVFEFPAGNVIDYDYFEDGSLAANNFTVIGAGSNEGQLQLTASSSSQISNGWALLEDVASYSDINDSSLLSNIAAGRLAASANPPVSLKIVAPAFVEPQVGSYAVGDDIRVRIIDSRFPNGLDTIYRLTGLNVSPGETSGEIATLSLTLPTS